MGINNSKGTDYKQFLSQRQRENFHNTKVPSFRTQYILTRH